VSFGEVQDQVDARKCDLAGRDMMPLSSYEQSGNCNRRSVHQVGIPDKTNLFDASIRNGENRKLFIRDNIHH
jgi:hypothetical protein